MLYRILKVIFTIVAGSCLYIGMDNMKHAFRRKKNALTEEEKKRDFKILMTISVSFFIAAFGLVMLGYLCYKKASMG